MTEDRRQRLPRFWLPFLAWIPIFAFLCMAATLTADMHYFWGVYPWTEPTFTFHGRNMLLNSVSSASFYVQMALFTATYTALLMIALLPFLKKSSHNSSLTLRVLSAVAIAAVLTLMLSRLVQALLLHFNAIKLSSDQSLAVHYYRWLTYPSAALPTELPVAAALVVLLTISVILMRGREHYKFFRCLAVVGMWISVVLILIYGVWWCFDEAINSKYTVLTLSEPTSSFLDVSDPWNYHHTGLALAVNALAFFAGFRFLLQRLIERRMRWTQSSCGTCGYDLAGISGTCPECGTVLTPQTS